AIARRRRKSDEGGSALPFASSRLRCSIPANVTMQPGNHVTLPFARPAVLWSSGPVVLWSCGGNHFCTILHYFSRFRSGVSFFINHLRSQIAPPVNSMSSCGPVVQRPSHQCNDVTM